MNLPKPVPEFPVSDIQRSGDFYRQRMGFSVDWNYEDRFAGISRDATRIFLRKRTAEENEQRYSVLVWLNMNSESEVDQLFEDWKRNDVSFVNELETTPYNLRQFTATDLDGNRFRVFFDVGSR